MQAFLYLLVAMTLLDIITALYFTQKEATSEDVLDLTVHKIPVNIFFAAVVAIMYAITSALF